MENFYKVARLSFLPINITTGSRMNKRCVSDIGGISETLHFKSEVAISYC